MTLPSFHCLHPDCGRFARHRGLCQSCYDRLRFTIRAGEETWESAEAAGKCLPANKAGQNPRGGRFRG